MLIERMERRARALTAAGDDTAAEAAWLDVLKADPAHREATSVLAYLAAATGRRSAAKTLWRQAIRCNPDDAAAHVNLGNLLIDEGDSAAGCAAFRAALSVDPDCAPAHRGLARALAAAGETVPEAHRRNGFGRDQAERLPYRGPAAERPVLLLTSAKGGNAPTRVWLNDRDFASYVVSVEFFTPAHALPPHVLVINAIADAELCADALIAASGIAARSVAPVINPPALVRRTGRAENAARLGRVAGVRTPRTVPVSRAALRCARDLAYPLLLRTPGRQTGQDFVRVEDPSSLGPAIDSLPGDELLLIEYIDARGEDGFVRKYRVMCVGGTLYPLHLAVSDHWKVHYYTAGMAERPSHQQEERRFLQDMRGVLGGQATGALTEVFAALGLDYAGADFTLAPDGRVVLFEANAAMTVARPPPGEGASHRTAAADAVLDAVRTMLLDRACA